MISTVSVATDSHQRDDYYSCNASRISIRALVLTMDHGVEASTCNRSRVLGGLANRIDHRGLQRQNLSVMKSTGHHRGLARDNVGIFAKWGRSCCRVCPRHRSACTILSVWIYHGPINANTHLLGWTHLRDVSLLHTFCARYGDLRILRLGPIHKPGLKVFVLLN